MTSLGTNVDPITNLIEKYKEDSSIAAIKYTSPCQSLSLETVNRKEILHEIKKLK